MKKFLLKIFAFFFSVLILFLICLFFVPDIRSENSLLAALPDKHALLAKAISPKIILVGGSNVSFGFNSQKIIDAYNMPVINTGITISLGLKFILDDVKPYINKGDIVVLSVDYECYKKSEISSFDGKEELVPLLFDIFPKGRNYLDFDQKIHLLHYLPNYSFSKLTVKNLFSKFQSVKPKSGYDDFYGRYSFNKYGDAYIHWTLPSITFSPEEKCNGNEQINPDVTNFLTDFRKYVTAKNATLVMIPPPLEATSFENQEFFIKKVALELKKIDLPLVSGASRYEFADKYFFNNPYHLNKSGVDKHTDIVIADLSKIIRH